MDVFTVDDLELIKKLIKELVNKNERDQSILMAFGVNQKANQRIFQLLKNNPHCSQLIPRELNEEIKIHKYKFSNRGW